MMKILFAHFYLLLTLTLHANESLCTLKLIKNEVSKFHGPEWNHTLQYCSKQNIKNHLKQIVENPHETLSEYDMETQKFLYRNSVKSFGHFGKEVEDLKILAALYNNKNNQIDNYFGEQANIFRITILEAMANTGNLESLNFFQKIMENDNNVLFLQQSAADFAAWVIDGPPLNQEDFQEGSKIYGEYFFPNLQLPLDLRIKDTPHLLEKFHEKKITLKNLLQDMLLRNDRFAPIAISLKKLQHVLENEKSENPILEHNNSQSSSSMESELPMSADQSRRYAKKPNLENNTRKPASLSQEDNNSSAIYRYLLLALILALSYLLWRKLKN
jgi:hypothetical protein